jgi:hypothetical protein
MMSSLRRAEGLPPVDERLVAADSGWEIIDGKAVEVPGCDEPHGTRQSKVAALLEASVREDFDVAVEMLTRTSKIDDFAPDVSVFPRARDPRTGGRQIEQLAFEVVNKQALSKAGEKAAKLARRASAACSRSTSATIACSSGRQTRRLGSCCPTRARSRIPASPPRCPSMPSSGPPERTTPWHGRCWPSETPC